jgi:hypothetical protein
VKILALDVTGRCRKLHNEGRYNFCIALNLLQKYFVCSLEILLKYLNFLT